MRKLNFIGAFLVLLVPVKGQEPNSISLQQCYELAKANYPLVKQMALIEKTKEYSIDNASKGYLPQINFAGQATYQSDVTSFPVKIPGMVIPEISKDQYKVYGEINQSLTDAIIIKQQKELLKTNSVIDVEKTEVELYKLKDRINQLYFGVLLIDEQLIQTAIVKKDIQSAIKKVNAGIENGVAINSSSDMLNAELLKADQRVVELKTNRKGFTDMLSIFINKPIDEATEFKKPELQAGSASNNRPELRLFETQKNSLNIQNKLLLAKNLPRLSLFFQGGYGRPALNFLNNDFKTYYIGGVRFNWNITGFYTFKKDKKLVGINQSLVEVQKEIFLFNTNILLKQQNSEISKLSDLITTDNQIIKLRENIKRTASSQLENGTITTTEYINYVNAEDQAKQNLALHQIQLLLSQYNLQTTTGN